MENQITILQALQVTKEMLEKIPVRIADQKTIAQPIAGAVHNLEVVMEAMEKEAQNNERKDNQDPGENVER